MNTKKTIESFSFDLVFRLKQISCWSLFHEYLVEMFKYSPNHLLNSIQNLKSKSKKQGKKKPPKDHENAIIVFDDVLGSSNSRYINKFFISGQYVKLEIYYLSQSYFDWQKWTIYKKKW